MVPPQKPKNTVTLKSPSLTSQRKDLEVLQEDHYHQLASRFEALQEIAVLLMNTRDAKSLLKLIVDKAVELLVCDAASLYLRHNEHQLIFEIAINKSIKINFEKRVIPMADTGIANYAFRSGKSVILKDVYQLPADVPYTFNRSFDEKVSYRTRSVVAQPLKSSKGEPLGALQLINRKNRHDEHWPSQNESQLEKMPEFTPEDLKLLGSFAALASASIENALLYSNIGELFEGFVKASVDAIERRDPPTRGHSERVALLTCDLAEKVSRSQDAEIRDIKFDDNKIAELRYAALLHDFGKIGIREATLLKAEKLFPDQKLRIRSRLDEFARAAETRTLYEFIERLQKNGHAPSSEEVRSLQLEISKMLEEFDRHWEAITNLNRPTVVDEEVSHRIAELSLMSFLNYNGMSRKLLESDEVDALRIKRGSLSFEERLEIEAHVTHTYRFLKQIPWATEYQNVPDIAFAHHEKLDGSGYPRRIKAPDIPPQSQIMTICDIYDALVASDRPYKKALPAERALSILEDETKQGKLQRPFLKVFIEARVFENPDFLELMDPSFRRKKAA